MAPFEKYCLATGCTEHPCYGYQPTRSAPVKWACPGHKHLLERAAPQPAEIVPKEREDLFGPR